MNIVEVAKFLEKNNEKLFPNPKYTEEELEAALLSLPDAYVEKLKAEKMRDPSTVQILAVFPGMIGIDRFYMGDIAVGILKYFTMGVVGILWIADIMSAKKRCREYNCRKLMTKISELLASSPHPSLANIEEVGAMLENDEVDFAAIDAQFSDDSILNSTEEIAQTQVSNEIKREQVLDSAKKAIPIVKSIAKGFKGITDSFYVK